MIRRIFKILLFIFAGIIGVVLVILVILWFNSPGKPQPITSADGNTLESSISVIEEITLGGHEQHLIIRGADKTKPVMLFLHGGPGSPEMSFVKHYNPGIENHFVMVYWEQLGSGKSFAGNIPAASMTLSHFVSDTRELSEYLARRFNQDKIYLMGHSWGTLLGIMTAHQHPELFHAYFGIGQVAHQFKGEQISFAWVKEQAVLKNDTKAEKILSEMNFPDSIASSKEWMDFLLKERQYVTEFGGAMHQTRGMWPLLKIFLTTKEYTLGDKVDYVKGSLFSIEKLWPDVINANLFQSIDSMKVPVYIFQGIHDYQTPYVIAKGFYDHLKAPEKEFFRFENSAHSPIMEEADRFNSIVLEKSWAIKPAASKGAF